MAKKQRVGDLSVNTKIEAPGGGQYTITKKFADGRLQIEGTRYVDAVVIKPKDRKRFNITDPKKLTLALIQKGRPNITEFKLKSVEEDGTIVITAREKTDEPDIISGAELDRMVTVL